MASDRNQHKKCSSIACINLSHHHMIISAWIKWSSRGSTPTFGGGGLLLLFSILSVPGMGIPQPVFSTVYTCAWHGSTLACLLFCAQLCLTWEHLSLPSPLCTPVPVMGAPQPAFSSVYMEHFSFSSLYTAKLPSNSYFTFIPSRKKSPPDFLLYCLLIHSHICHPWNSRNHLTFITTS